MSSCTFFRNFAGFANGGLLVINAFPMAVVVDGTDFIHNDALVWPDDGYYQKSPVGRTPALASNYHETHLACLLRKEVKSGRALRL